MSQISGSDLFGKNGGDNLNRSNLKKAKKKGGKKLEELLKANLGYLVEYYFTTFRKGEEKRKYESHLLKLLGSDSYFIKPLAKIIKKNKKKDDFDIPNGLNTMLMDSIDEVRFMYRRKLNQMEGGGKLSDDARSRINTIKTLAEILVNDTMEICNMCVKKQIKGLEKIGLMEEYAEILARTYVPAKLLNPNNVRRYVYRTNLAIYEIQKVGLSPIEDSDEYHNSVGVNLGSPDTIKEIYEYMFDGISKKTFISMLVGIMLERRGGAFEHFTKPQLGAYNAITKFAMDILEGVESIKIASKDDKDKYSLKKKKKKKGKKFTFGKKELKQFMKLYSEERTRDIAKHRDSARRISFSSGIAEDAYPNIIKAFRNVNKEYFDSLFDNGDENHDNRDNRNNDKRDKDRDNNRDNNRDDRRDRNNNWKRDKRRD